MGTTSNLLPTIATFSGTSQYAADLQNAINHAVTVAAIPLNNLQSDVSTLQSQSSELNSLQSNFTSIQSAIQKLSSASGAGALAATVSDRSVASASVDSTVATTSGTYTLNVIDPGSPTTAVSSNG